MGITIHYLLIRGMSPKPLLTLAKEEARKRGMEISLQRENRIIIEPHLQSESLEFYWLQWKTIKAEAVQTNPSDDGDYIRYARETVEHYFSKMIHDEDWVCLGFVKTQFAGVACHRDVAELLRKIGSFCRLANIDDEADYYEEGFKGYGTIKKKFDYSNKAISNLAAQLKAEFGAENVLCGQDLASVETLEVTP